MTEAEWTSKPSNEQLQQRIDAFMTALSAADLKRAFAICPCTEFESANKAKMFEYLEHAMFQFLVDSEEDEDDEDADDDDEDEDDEEDEEESDDDEDEDDEEADEPAVLEKPKTWLTMITPPSECDFDDFQLEVEGDEVMANVYVDGEVSDITARYRLEKKKNGWRLCFENFDVM